MASRVNGGEGWAIPDIAHHVMTAVLTAAVLGGVWFYNDTNVQIALLQRDVQALDAKIDGFVALMREARLSTAASPPKPEP